MKKTILVTGGAGYVGAQTCKVLSKAGYNPVAFDNLEYGHEYAVKWGDLVKGDLNNINDIQEALTKYQPVAVIHCAAYTYVGESQENPYKYYMNNIYASLNLFKAMLDHNIKFLVFSSTCATYGEITLPLLENSPQEPINTYGRTKLMVESILKDFDNAYNFKHIIVRYFNVAGADTEGEIGEDHNPETHLIPLIIDVALGKKESISVFGNNYSTPDGTCIRDYIHTEDLALAHLKSLEYLFTNNQSNNFNLGSGEGYSVLQIIKEVEKTSGKSIPIDIHPRRSGDPAVLLATYRKALDILKWKPTHNIHSIVKTAYDWHLKKHGS